MEGLLTPVSTSYKAPDEETGAFLSEVKRIPAVRASTASRDAKRPESPNEILEVLRNEPDYDSLILALQILQSGTSHFSITSPSPLAAQLVHVLVSETLPTYWNILYASQIGKGLSKQAVKPSTDLKLFLSCLRSVTGLNAILLHLKQAIQNSKESKKSIGGENIQGTLTTLLEALSAVLEGNGIIEKIYQNIRDASNSPAKQKALWNDYLGLVSGKILSIAAEAEDSISGLSKGIGKRYWTSDGELYSHWLSRNIAHWVLSIISSSDSVWTSCSELLAKSLRLGYTDNITKVLIEVLAIQPGNDANGLKSLLENLPALDQKTFLYASLTLISRNYLSPIVTSHDDVRWWESDSSLVAATAKVITKIMGDGELRKDQLVSWLTSPSGAGIGEGIGIRRAAIAALAVDKEATEMTLDKSLSQFGDQLYIRHTPLMQQEAHAQVLLLSAGCVHRKAPLRLATILRSGTHLNVVSNRLAAASPRARFLGMVVGEALSGLVDKGDKKMDFKLEEMSTPEAMWYKSLITVSDVVGSMDGLRSGPITRVGKTHNTAQVERVAHSTIRQGSSKIVAIEEIDDDTQDELDSDGLIPHEKPDSDMEDEDEDATLVTRNKPTAPVYIRDLILYLRDTDNYDKQKLALNSAASLIRRKANFGAEVSSHAEELATLLVGLQDRYDMENFSEMRSQGMIAILIAEPLKMGQWYSKTFFDGDYSLSQRASVLTTLGRGARELGGFGTEETNVPTTTKTISSSSFPSNTLPKKMHKIYATPEAEAYVLDRLSTQLSNTMIAPMAAELADKLTGPSILKVRTFSSRMAVEKKRKKPIANTLAKVVADGFFFPLTGRFFVHLKAYGSSRSNVVFQPYLLTLFLKTLSLLIHASGPSTLSLPQMTSEFWDLLLSLRTQSIGDSTVVEALLFAFLTILEINDDKRTLVEAHGRQMLETQEWVEGVFSKMNSSGSEEDERIRMLAAGCLVRIREVVEKYQSLLMGDLVSF